MQRGLTECKLPPPLPNPFYHRGLSINNSASFPYLLALKVREDAAASEGQITKEDYVKWETGWLHIPRRETLGDEAQGPGLAICNTPLTKTGHLLSPLILSALSDSVEHSKR